MTNIQMAAIAAIETQQKGRKRDAIWMVGEQLKDICRREERSAQLIAEDLKSESMSLAAAEDEVERLRKQLATADTATVVFQERFSAVQEDFEALRKAWAAIEDTDKRQKLVRAVQAVLAQQGDTWK